MRNLLFLFLPFAAACGVDRDIEHRLTITTGVYGQTTSFNDVGANMSPKYYQMDIELRGRDDVHLANTRSADQGFYEIATAPGPYRICTSFGRCTNIDIAVDQRLRCDYEFGLSSWDC